MTITEALLRHLATTLRPLTSDNKKQQNLNLPKNIKVFTASYLTQKEVEKFANIVFNNQQKSTTHSEMYNPVLLRQIVNRKKLDQG